ncbi:MAG: hypothetical protein FWC01_01735 [Treponema sp.]|nr:hypothetical protein [Treponema sp.]MCL2236843.1 hypothetical protein [Treponema sp.]
MKKEILLMAILAAAVSLGSCVGLNDLGILNENIPEEMRVNLEIRNNLSVALYNNMPVNWSPGLTKNAVAIVIPPGESTFLVRWTETSGSGAYMRTYDRTKTLTQTLIPGHSYQIRKTVIWLLFITITDVSIKDVTPRGR